MPDIIQELFCDPPIAIARLGGSTTPLAAYSWQQPPNPRADGETVIQPEWSLNILTDGSVDPFKPNSIRFRDGDLIRPVCPFVEIWARLGEPDSDRATWHDEPLTPALLTAQGVDESALLFRIDARNTKASRRRLEPNLTFGTFPPVQIRGDQHRPTPLNAVSPPGAPQPMIPVGRVIPLGSVQVMRSRPQPAPGSAPWTEAVDVEVIRFRFTPARGRFFGPPAAAQPADASPVPAVDPANAFLNPSAGWFNVEGDANPFVIPPDTFDQVARRSNQSLGVVDDTCEARIDVELALPGPQARTLRAHANIFAGPPDFAPDRRPFLSLADELNDRAADSVARSDGMGGDELDAWVQDLFERVYETVSLMNVDFWRTNRGIRQLPAAKLSAVPLAGDGAQPDDQAMGSRDALRNPILRVGPTTPNNPLPISIHARERHRALSDVGILRAFVVQNPNRLRQLIRAAFEIEQIEDSGVTTMRMPPFMRQSNALPLTLSAWQYDLLMRWVGEVLNPPGALVAAAARAPAAADLSERAEARRTDTLRRLG
jgi:hypothetical protein